MDYNNKRFRPIKTSGNAEVSGETIFYYRQEGNILTSEYEGGAIVKGHLIGLVDEAGNIEMRYHQINSKGELMTGTCSSRPQIMANGKIRLYESWQWTSGNTTKGTSVLEEL